MYANNFCVTLHSLWESFGESFVVYDSKHGNFKLAAAKILDGITEVERFEASIGYVEEVETGKLVESEELVLEAPNHMGRHFGTMKKFVNGLSVSSLKAKNAAVFGTYARLSLFFIAVPRACAGNGLVCVLLQSHSFIPSDAYFLDDLEQVF